MTGPVLQFSKVQSLGNDFVLVHLNEVDERDMPSIAQQVSDRRFSVGCDGLLAVGQTGDHIRLRMFNSDGSEDFCGNGIRCAAIYAFEQGWTGPEMTIHHRGKEVRVAILDDCSVRSTFDPPDFSPSAVPLARNGELFMEPVDVLGRPLVLSSVSTGSTHTVILSDKIPEDDEFLILGPAIENHPLFPDRTSVIWAVLEQGDRLRIRIWERGVGETLGCGTGSAAAAIVYARHVDRPSSYCLINPGGEVLVSIPQIGSPIITTARAEILYAGRFYQVRGETPIF